MKNTVGTSAGVLALLAVLMHAFVISPNEGKSGATSGDKQGGQQSLTSNAETPVEAAPAQGPWLASRQYFHLEPPSTFKSDCMEYLVPQLGVSAQCNTQTLRELFGLGRTFEPGQLTA